MTLTRVNFYSRTLTVFLICSAYTAIICVSFESIVFFTGKSVD